ncbi:MAG: hypothetical protein A4E20_01370 [Nitrospira sp. SG-bin2]|uniref:deoxynucleotide monophosphate kinase family protein n=1 Tax=Nitrospira cf. moscoviensis SBR1015 TaxID=96242 RepID=UPI000A0BD347|nr:hypothetical protein [Nitrospira cf. moscoviensis SBR1015]OQW34854.1 MAG: hypothetical protein A4E20_01370 [Nitrospira sp. SG-bin2]
MKPRLIGLTGYVGSGKSLAANHLLPHGYIRTRYAVVLKMMLKTLGLSNAEVDGHLKEQPCALLGGKTPRHAMLTLGTEWGRQMIDWDIWVRALMRHVDQYRADPLNTKGIVIDDVRFANEAQAIKDRGGVIWRIDRPGVGQGSCHISETGQSEIVPDLIIVNDGDKCKLAESVLTALYFAGEAKNE